jgi:hypothetical protein
MHVSNGKSPAGHKKIFILLAGYGQHLHAILPAFEN